MFPSYSKNKGPLPWLAVGGYQGRKICSFSLGMWLLAGCSWAGEWLQWVHVAIRGSLVKHTYIKTKGGMKLLRGWCAEALWEKLRKKW